MKLSSSTLKSILSKHLSCNPADLKRTSKSKNDKKEVVRVFEVNAQRFEITTDENDEKVLSINELTSESATSKQPTGGYVFAVSTLVEPPYVPGLPPMINVSIVKEPFWNKNKYLDDSPQRKLEKILPSHYESPNESSSFVAYKGNFMDVISELESLGFKYNNDLAQFLDQGNPNPEYFIKP